MLVVLKERIATTRESEIKSIYQLMMPRRCCAPNCKGNYDTTLRDHDYTSTFMFPKNEELRKKWIDAVPRKNWTPTKYSALCSLHFAESDIERYQGIISPEGVLENVLMTRPRLVPNAVPTIFDNSPPCTRQDPVQKKETAECQESTETAGNEMTETEQDSSKRKVESSHNESVEKIQKTSQGDKAVNILILQRPKQMTIQNPSPQSAKAQGSQVPEEIKRQQVIDEGKISKLQKKLEAVEVTVSSLSASHRAELKAKEEILQQLNGDWESSNKYYYEISESLKEFQEYKDNLSKLYNNVIVKQQSTIKKLQQELSALRLKDDGRKDVVGETENKTTEHEKRLYKMTALEMQLKKQLEEAKKKSILEKTQLNSIHAKEKLEIMKEQEKLESVNKDLQVQIEKIVKEKQNLTSLLTEKDVKISKLQKEVNMCKNKVQVLLQRNTELNSKYEETARKEEELRMELEAKIDYLDTIEEIETSFTDSDLEKSLEEIHYCEEQE